MWKESLNKFLLQEKINGQILGKKFYVVITFVWRISCMIKVVYEETDVEKSSDRNFNGMKDMWSFFKKKFYVVITSVWRITCMIKVVYEEMDVEKSSGRNFNGMKDVVIF